MKLKEHQVYMSLKTCTLPKTYKRVAYSTHFFCNTLTCSLLLDKCFINVTNTIFHILLLQPLCTPIGASSKVVQLFEILRSKNSECISILTWFISAFTNFSKFPFLVLYLTLLVWYISEHHHRFIMQKVEPCDYFTRIVLLVGLLWCYKTDCLKM